MRALHLIVATPLVLVACRSKTTLPDDLAGTYTQARGVSMQNQITATERGQPPEMVGMNMGLTTTRELTVTTGGMSSRGQSPLSGPQMRIGSVSMGFDDTVSDLFTEVDCAGSKSCRFKTKEDCEGTLERGAKGELIIVANGACSAWSGTWSPAAK